MHSLSGTQSAIPEKRSHRPGLDCRVVGEHGVPEDDGLVWDTVTTAEAGRKVWVSRVPCAARRRADLAQAGDVVETCSVRGYLYVFYGDCIDVAFRIDLSIAVNKLAGMGPCALPVPGAGTG